VTQKEEELEGIKTFKSVSEFPSPTTTSVSIITPPKVSPFQIHLILTGDHPIIGYFGALAAG
jgi:hypothetical protein